MNDRIEKSLLNDALNMVIQAGNPPKGLIWHTDRGSQYASHERKDCFTSMVLFKV